jgi:hypothetical protein
MGLLFSICPLVGILSLHELFDRNQNVILNGKGRSNEYQVRLLFKFDGGRLSRNDQCLTLPRSQRLNGPATGLPLDRQD